MLTENIRNAIESVARQTDIRTVLSRTAELIRRFTAWFASKTLREQIRIVLFGIAVLFTISLTIGGAMHARPGHAAAGAVSGFLSSLTELLMFAFVYLVGKLVVRHFRGKRK